MQNILKKVSYHAVYDDSILNALQFARQHGFAGVQVAAETPHLDVTNLTDGQCAEIAAFCREHSLRTTLHGPDFTASLFAANRLLREGLFGYLNSLIQAAEKLGCPIITLHAGAPPSFGTSPRTGRSISEADAKTFQRALEENLRRLSEMTGERVTVCIENFQLTPMATEALEPFLERGELALCWDLPKAHDDPHVQAFMRRNLSRIRQVHLHDVTDGSSHQVIGTGSMDFDAYLPRLAQADVLDYCIEVRPREKALESLDNLKQLVQRH